MNIKHSSQEWASGISFCGILLEKSSGPTTENTFWADSNCLDCIKELRKIKETQIEHYAQSKRYEIIKVFEKIEQNYRTLIYEKDFKALIS